MNTFTEPSSDKPTLKVCFLKPQYIQFGIQVEACIVDSGRQAMTHYVHKYTIMTNKKKMRIEIIKCRFIPIILVRDFGEI